jgi:protein required for attachment to host cells
LPFDSKVEGIKLADAFFEPFREVVMHWFVLASEKEVRIFIRNSEKTHLQLLKTITNPVTVEKRRSLIHQAARHSTQASLQIAKEIVHFLKSEKRQKHFDALTIVAEAHLLGKIRAEMEPSLKHSVVRWLNKDLQNFPEQDLAHFLLPQAAS